MENVQVPCPKHPKPPDSQNDNKENKLHSLKEVPKRGFVQIKESFRTLKNVNRQPIVKGEFTAVLHEEVQYDFCTMFGRIDISTVIFLIPET